MFLEKADPYAKFEDKTNVADLLGSVKRSFETFIKVFDIGFRVMGYGLNKPAFTDMHVTTWMVPWCGAQFNPAGPHHFFSWRSK